MYQLTSRSLVGPSSPVDPVRSDTHGVTEKGRSKGKGEWERREPNMSGLCYDR